MKPSQGPSVQDLLASVAVFLVALPLGMGIAMASGLPPALGLITGIVGGIVVGILQGSPLSISGPAAGLVVLVWDVVQKHGQGGLAVVVLMVGVIQILAGVLRGGRWFRAVPPSVIHGMMGGIGVLIFVNQFHVMVDDKPKSSGLMSLITLPLAVWKGVRPQPDLPHEEAALIGVLTIIVLVLWTRFAPKKLKTLPGALVAVATGTVVARVFKLPIAFVDVPASLVSVLHLPTGGDLHKLLDPSLLVSGAAMAVIASAETLLCASAVDRMHSGPRTNYNRELIAQGVGNTICGLIGAPPMTGVIVRSSTNVQAGARTRLSAILHGVWLLGLVVGLPFVLRLIPVCSLAAVLVYTGWKLVNPGIVKTLRRYGKWEVTIYVVTIVAIVSTDLLKGVLIGLALAIGKLLYSFSRLDIQVDSDVEKKRTVLQLRGSATFLRLPEIAEALDAIPADHEIHVRFEDLEYLDHATLELLQTWERQHRANGGDVIIEWDALDRKYQTGRSPQLPDKPEGPDPASSQELSNAEIG